MADQVVYRIRPPQNLANGVTEVDRAIADVNGNKILPVIAQVAYAELVALIANQALIPGRKYRITDYAPSNAGAGASGIEFKMAGHAFDIVVTATSTSRVNENALAMPHDGDTYFVSANLAAWQLKYTLSNDVTEFDWAGGASGHGTIYWMKDEWNNECCYDFKNVLIKHEYISGHVGAQYYFYTFSAVSDNDPSHGITDATLLNKLALNDAGPTCTENVIGIRTNNGNNLPDGAPQRHRSLNNIVLVNEFSAHDFLYFTCSGNHFENDCYDIYIGSDGCANTFGVYCNGLRLGANCTSNVFDGFNYAIYLEDGCDETKIGRSAYVITIAPNSYGNTIETGCVDIHLGVGCSYNRFGAGCGHMNLGTNCEHNEFGDNCLSIDLNPWCRHDRFGAACHYLKVTGDGQDARDLLVVDDYFSGASDVSKFDLYDSAILNKSYQVRFSKDSSGKYVMSWLSDGSTASVGKYKASNTDASWVDIPQKSGVSSISGAAFASLVGVSN